MRRLVVAPHADDEVLGCGGLLAKYPADSMVLVVAEADAIRGAEFLAAKEVLGYAEAAMLCLPDGQVGDDMRGLVRQLDRAIGNYRPDELYLPFPSMHQDHIAVYEAGMRSARLSMNEHHHYPPSVLVYDVAAYDLELYPSDLRWNVFESLTQEQAELKAKAVLAYGSQQVRGPHPLSGIVESARMLGASRRLAFAEQFCLVREVRP